MLQHRFIASPGSWVGEGKIILNMVEEDLIFYTVWNVLDKDFSGIVTSVQNIQIQGLSEGIQNEMRFFDFSKESFGIEMQNQNVGKVIGRGVFDEKMIAWEFRGNNMKFEGYESYILQNDGTYKLKGEYISSDQFRTQVQGTIWKQTEAPLDGEVEREEDTGTE
ncbi:MAG: hypothetical protein AAGI90_06005 [Chlamydiota bacterium]